MSVSRRTAVWLVGSAVGAVVIALPDSDDRVFSLSKTHGPAAVDLVGVVLLLVAWAPIAVLLWSSRDQLSGRLARVAATLALVGLVWLVVTVATDVTGAWLVGVALLTVAQLLAVARIQMSDRRRARR